MKHRTSLLSVLLMGLSTALPACSSKAVDSAGTVSMAEFEKIQTGMSYEEVCKIIGGEGKELSRVAMSGVPTTVMYAWDGSGSLGANMNCTFQGGRLVSKAQFGLK